MHPSSPLDLIWRALAPFVQQIEALGHVLEFCAAYYSWCAGCAAGLALLLLTGLVLQEARDEYIEHARHEGNQRAREPNRARGADHFEWGAERIGRPRASRSPASLHSGRAIPASRSSYLATKSF